MPHTPFQRTLLFPCSIILACSLEGAITFTDSASFLSSLEAGYIEQDFSSLAGELVAAPPLSYSDGGFSYSIITSAPQFRVLNKAPNISTAIAPAFPDKTVTLTFTSGTVTALGGNFFLSSFGGDLRAGALTITLNDGTFLTVNSEATGPLPFAGITTSLSNPITSFTLTTDASSSHVALDNLIIGQVAVVPEVSSACLPFSLFALMLFRRRK